MNIVFMGTPEFAVPTLEVLHQEGHNISLVITQKDKPKGRGKKIQYTPVKEKALELNLEVFQPDNINDSECVNKLIALNPDIIIVVAFGQILKKEILNLPKHGCLNIHASLLPKYRGAAPINWALINGEKETGITIMKMDEGLDTGDMLLKESIPINNEDDYTSIHDKLSKSGGDLIIKAIDQIKRGTIINTPQDHSLSSYAPMIYKSTGKIDWNNTGEKIHNQVMGLKPWPSAYTIYNEETVKIHKVNVVKKFSNDSVGKIVKVSKEGIYVNALDSCVIIEELQFPGKKKLTVREYLAGNNIEVGVILQ